MVCCCFVDRSCNCCRGVGCIRGSCDKCFGICVDWVLLDSCCGVGWVDDCWVDNCKIDCCYVDSCLICMDWGLGSCLVDRCMGCNRVCRHIVIDVVLGWIVDTVCLVWEILVVGSIGSCYRCICCSDLGLGCRCICCNGRDRLHVLLGGHHDGRVVGRNSSGLVDHGNRLLFDVVLFRGFLFRDVCGIRIFVLLQPEVEVLQYVRL